MKGIRHGVPVVGGAAEEASQGSYGGFCCARFWKNSLSRDHPGWKRSLPEADELRDPSWQASPYHEGISQSLPEAEEPRDQCQSPRGGLAGLRKFHSLPEAMGPSGKAIVASCVQGPQGSVDCLSDFGEDCRRRKYSIA